jgi:hypothetical protein
MNRWLKWQNMNIIVLPAAYVETLTIWSEGNAGKRIRNLKDLSLDRFAMLDIEDEDILIRSAWQLLAVLVVQEIVAAGK